MPDDFASDEQLIEDAHKALEAALPPRSYKRMIPPAQAAADDAITAIGKRLIQRSEERQAARDALAEIGGHIATISAAALEASGRLRQEFGTMRRPTINHVQHNPNFGK